VQHETSRCSTTAAYCRTLQRTATHCNTAYIPATELRLFIFDICIRNYPLIVPPPPLLPTHRLMRPSLRFFQPRASCSTQNVFCCTIDRIVGRQRIFTLCRMSYVGNIVYKAQHIRQMSPVVYQKRPMGWLRLLHKIIGLCCRI